MSEQEVQIVQFIEVRFQRGAGTDEDPTREVVAYRQLDGQLVAELDPIATGVLIAPPPRRPVIPRLRVGDERMMTLYVRARVVDDSESHGLCYELELETRMYNDGRIVSVDADEIIDIGMVPR